MAPQTVTELIHDHPKSRLDWEIKTSVVEENSRLKDVPDKFMRNNSNIPTEQDWGNYLEDLDTKWAYHRFAGRTIGEVLPYFHSSSL